jgi:hypothetical protein
MGGYLMITAVGDYYIQGIIMSIICVGFYFYGLAHLTIRDSSLKTFLKLLYSFCTAWILNTTICASMPALVEYTRIHINWFLLAVKYIFPYITLIGFQMHLYNLFKEED